MGEENNVKAVFMGRVGFGLAPKSRSLRLPVVRILTSGHKIVAHLPSIKFTGCFKAMFELTSRRSVRITLGYLVAMIWWGQATAESVASIPVTVKTLEEIAIYPVREAPADCREYERYPCEFIDQWTVARNSGAYWRQSGSAGWGG